jgi:hypothetical protein
MTEMLRRILSELHRNPEAGVKDLSQILYPDNPAMLAKVAKALVQLETLGFIDGEGKPTSKALAHD